MSAKSRKPLMLAGLGLIAVVYAGDWALTNWIDEPKKQRRAQVAAISAEIQKYEQYIGRTQQDAQWIRYWYNQSLPADAEVARSLYQAWLLEAGDYVGLANRTVNSTEPMNRGAYFSMNFTMRGIGTLEQLTQFLYEFYNAGHLHKINSISLTPMGGSGHMDLTLVVEALILRGNPRRDRLGESRAYRLASFAIDEYDVIAERNLFSAGGGSGTDPTSHTYLTAVNFVNNEPEAWFTQRTDGAVMKLRLGDGLVQTGDRLRKVRSIDDLEGVWFDGLRSSLGAVGEIEAEVVLVECAGRYWEPSLSATGDGIEFRPFGASVTEIGRVAEIEDTDLVLHAGDEQWLLSIGDRLSEAYALPPEL